MFNLRLLVAFGFVLGFVAAGCGGGDNDADQRATTSFAGSSVPFDRSFIDAMVPHHRAAIDMAKAAKAAGLAQPELIEIADAIITTQQEEIETMLQWREAWFGSRELDPQGPKELERAGVDLGMDHSGEDIADAADVDTAFAAAMIPHHEGAVRMAELAWVEAQHAEIRQLADEVVEAQEREIEKLRKHASGEHHG